VTSQAKNRFFGMGCWLAEEPRQLRMLLFRGRMRAIIIRALLRCGMSLEIHLPGRDFFLALFSSSA
jgi:hypothetical protein